MTRIDPALLKRADANVKLLRASLERLNPAIDKFEDALRLRSVRDGCVLLEQDALAARDVTLKKELLWQNGELLLRRAQDNHILVTNLTQNSAKDRVLAMQHFAELIDLVT